MSIKLTSLELAAIRNDIKADYVSRMSSLTREEWREFGEWWEDGDPEFRFTQAYLEEHHPERVAKILKERDA